MYLMSQTVEKQQGQVFHQLLHTLFASALLTWPVSRSVSPLLGIEPTPRRKVKCRTSSAVRTIHQYLTTPTNCSENCTRQTLTSAPQTPFLPRSRTYGTPGVHPPPSHASLLPPWALVSYTILHLSPSTFDFSIYFHTFSFSSSCQ